MKTNLYGWMALSLGYLLGGGPWGIPAAEAAGKKEPVKSAPATVVNVGELTTKLKSGDPAEQKAALAEVKGAGKDGAPLLPAVTDLLQRGASPDVVSAAFDALGG